MWQIKAKEFGSEIKQAIGESVYTQELASVSMVRLVSDVEVQRKHVEP